MKINNKIFLYLEGQLNEKEKSDFEEELRRSPKMKEELKKAEELFSFIFHAKETQAEVSYFENILPEFRRKLEIRKRRSFNFKYAYGLAAMIIIVFSILIISNLDNGNIETAANEYRNDDLIETSDLYYDDLDIADLNVMGDNYDSLINNMLFKELNISLLNADITEEYNIDLIELSEDINDEEAELIYNGIINKKFF